MFQGIADDLRGDGFGLQGHTVLQVSNTGQRQEGDGGLDLDTLEEPAVDGPHPSGTNICEQIFVETINLSGLS